MKNPEITVVTPCFNEEEVLPEFLSRVSATLVEAGVTHEIIVVNDGSRDKTLDTAIGLIDKYPVLKVISLSRNFGNQCALTAGIEEAKGAGVVIIDADLQDPPELIGEMIAKWREGKDVVYGKRRSREGETRFKLITATIFYRLLKAVTSVEIPVDTGDFRLMDRRVVEALLKMPEHHRFLRGMISWVGYEHAEVLYDRKRRPVGDTKFPFRKMLAFSLDAFTSFSIVPLRLLMFSGAAIMGLSILLALIVLLVKIVSPSYFIPGFPTLVLLIVFFGGLNVLAFGLVGEYVARIFEESKGRPLYLIDRVVTIDGVTIPGRGGDGA